MTFMTERLRNSNRRILSACAQNGWLSLHRRKRTRRLRDHLAATLAGLLLLAVSACAIEDPPNCSLAHGGAGNTSQGAVNFNFTQAHVGDTFPLFPRLGMVTNACRAITATCSIYVATGLVT